MHLKRKESSFYALLDELAESAHKAAKEFLTASQNFEHLKEHIDKLETIEHEADEIMHKLANKIDATFVTPLDKEDLRALASALDDITDHIEAATQRLALYRIEEPRPDLEPMVALLVKITVGTQEAVAALKHHPRRDKLQPLFIKIHEIENESDQAFRKALFDLFSIPNPDPMMVIKWKEIYDRVEVSVDKCEDAANIVESVVVKYA